LGAEVSTVQRDASLTIVSADGDGEAVFSAYRECREISQRAARWPDCSASAVLQVV